MSWAFTIYPLAVGAQQAALPATIGGFVHQLPIAAGVPDTPTHDQHWESNPRPSDLESNALST